MFNGDSSTDVLWNGITKKKTKKNISNAGTFQMIFNQIESVCRDLDQASMEAVAALLAGLPLQPEESDRGDLMEAKSQLFLK